MPASQWMPVPRIARSVIHPETTRRRCCTFRLSLLDVFAEVAQRVRDVILRHVEADALGQVVASALQQQQPETAEPRADGHHLGCRRRLQTCAPKNQTKTLVSADTSFGGCGRCSFAGALCTLRYQRSVKQPLQPLVHTACQGHSTHWVSPVQRDMAMGCA